MKRTHKGKKYLAVHAHFYQPPREDPWTGTIPRQDSAHPYSDWNERIARECYIPNAYARINDSMGRVVEMVNNYEYMNFNFGPTLLSWLEKRYPSCYARITAAAASSRAARGHSNAIAQSYNHTILPLSPFDDRLTQVLWGLADFERRFGFKAEAMWLPETAADADTLRLLIDQGLRYAILSPYQAERIKPPGSGKWTDVSSGAFDVRRPYVWKDRDSGGAPLPGRSIVLFFYDGPLSKAVAFEGAVRNSETFSARLAAAFDRDPEHDQLVTLAVDGETFGHHHKFSDMTLAHAFRHEIKRHGIETTNLASYLDSHPAEYEAEIKPGPDGDGTAWSCSHGLRRWKGGCDCGAEGQGHTRWRRGLREALNLLREAAIGVYRTRASALLKDIWLARNEYVSLFPDPSKGKAEAFLSGHASRPLSPEERTEALMLLGLQRDISFMFTSCGWFFSDISRIEPVQNLKHAAKAASVLRELGLPEAERDLKTALEAAPSNDPDFHNGRKVYEDLAAAAAQTPEKLAAFRLMKSLLPSDGARGEPDGEDPVDYIIKDAAAASSDGLETVTGRLSAEDPLLLKTEEYSFLYARRNGGLPVIWLSKSGDLEKLRELSGLPDLDAMRAGAAALSAAEIAPGDLPAERSSAVTAEFMRSIRRGNRPHLLAALRAYARLLETCPDSASCLPELKRETETYAELAFDSLFEELASGDLSVLDEIHCQAESLARLGLTLRFPSPPPGAADCALDSLADVRRNPSPGNLERLLKLLKAVRALGLHDAFFHLQNGLSELFAEVMKDPGAWADRAVQIKGLYSVSGMIVERFSMKMDGSTEAGVRA